MTTVNYTITAESMIPAPTLPWWQKLWRRIRRQPMPAPIQPPGTRPVILEMDNGWRVYMPAARISPTSGDMAGWVGTR